MMKSLLPLTDDGKSGPSRDFLKSQICFFNPIRENKLFAKIFEFTVYSTVPEPWHISSLFV